MPKREDTQILTAEGMAAFFEAAMRRLESRRFEALFVLALWTGMRPGELLGVLWSDLTLPDSPNAGEASQVDVRRALSETKKHGVVPREKTKTGGADRRQIPLVPEVVAVLKEHRRRQAAEELRYEGLREDLGLVFPNALDGYMSNGNLTQRHLKPILADAGLPESVRLYDLRHTFSTLWVEAGESGEVLQKVLGHTSYKTTVDRYVHVADRFQRDSFGRLARLRSGLPEQAFSHSVVVKAW